MDEQKKAELQQIANDCTLIAYEAVKTVWPYFNSGDGVTAVGLIAQTLLEHELKKRENESQ